MNPEIAHSHNVFPPQVSVDLSFTGAHLSAPVFETLDSGDVGDVLDNPPGTVRPDHDGSDHPLFAVKDVAAASLNKFGHTKPPEAATVRPAAAAKQPKSNCAKPQIHRGYSANTGETPRNSVLSIGLCSYFVPVQSSEFAASSITQAANGVTGRSPRTPVSPKPVTPTQSQRPISRADTAPRMNAAMSQSLHAREDLVGQSQCRRSRSDARPATLSWGPA